MIKLLFAGFLVAAVAIGAACTVASPWRRDLRNKRLDEARPVDLDGLATVRLAPTFHAAGTPRGDSRGVTFRFEQGQHTILGGYNANPVLLDVTLLAPTASKQIDGTTIATFYPPVDDVPRKAAHFAAQRWLPEAPAANDAGAVTRVAATNEGRGDNVSSGPPERWLAIHVDAPRRARVDLYAWRSAYSADEARSLVRQVASSVTLTPRLDAWLAERAAEEQRKAERGRSAPTEAATILRECGVERLTPGETTVGTTCAAHLSPDGLRLRAAALVGLAPLPASRATPTLKPQFTLAPDAPPLAVSLMWWDGARWAVEGLQYTLSGDDLRHPVLDAVAARLTDRASVYLLRTFAVDFEHYPQGVDGLSAFLQETKRQTAALTDGALLVGVRGATARLKP